MNRGFITVFYHHSFIHSHNKCSRGASCVLGSALGTETRQEMKNKTEGGPTCLNLHQAGETDKKQASMWRVTWETVLRRSEGQGVQR